MQFQGNKVQNKGNSNLQYITFSGNVLLFSRINHLVIAGFDMQWPAFIVTSAEHNYQNTLRFFHFHANAEFPKRMETQLLRLTLQTRNTCTQQTLAHPSKISLENSSNNDNFPTYQKNRPYYTVTGRRNEIIIIIIIIWALG